jgi:LysM repeat protein
MQRIFLILIAIILLSACSSPAPIFTSTPTPVLFSELTVDDLELEPYLTPSPSILSEPSNTPMVTAVPTITPTPLTYTIKKGDDLSSIAFSYGITLESLLSANPGVDPHLLSVGSEIVIPPGENDVAVTDTPSNPTPMPVTIQNVHCYPQNDGGAWCFLEAYNELDTDVESVSVLISLASENGLVSRTALTPLNLISINTNMPLLAYFPPPLVQPLQAGVELSSALPVPADDARYLDIEIENLEVNTAPDGLSAELTGDAILNSTDADASLVWIAGVAYDERGNVIGIRRWESSAPLGGSEMLNFDFNVYSVSDKITEVKVFAEARR